MRLLTAVVLLASLGACGDKKAAAPVEAASCAKSAHDGDACKACCTSAGKGGYMWNGMSNECSCI